MERLNVQTFLEATEAITRVVRSSLPADPTPIPADARRTGLRIFNAFLQTSTELNLVASAATVRRVIEVYSHAGSTYRDLREALRDLPTRLQDEMGAMSIFCLTASEAECYLNPQYGWEKIVARFPEVTTDIEEAQKCFAFGRYPAAVFHSLLVVEAGLIDLGTFLKVANPRSGWTAVSAALDKVIAKKHQERTTFERKNFLFLEQVQGTVAALKNAWRNKVSHAQTKLVLLSPDIGPDVAQEILFATRGFMRRLADGLPPRRPGR